MKKFILALLVWITGLALCGQTVLRRDVFLKKNAGLNIPFDSIAAKDYYRLGLQYKNGDGVPMDYIKAYENFKQAADLGDDQSIYSVGYMLYKGLGCQQDYKQAAALFAQGAYKGRDNSMYFLGLCFRNGYGINRNEDSAKYWLNKAAAVGYAQAKQELLMKAGENANDSATVLIHKIRNAAIPEKTVLNEFTPVKPHISSRDVVLGDYSGYLLSYDWSGTHIISNRAINFSLGKPDGSSDTAAIFSGKWIERGGMPVTLSAALKDDSLIFQHTQYRIKDHYSQQRAITYDFKAASLNLVQSGDSVYLAGNITMFSPDRNEPSKPLFIALVRKQTISASLADSSLVNTLKITKKDSTKTNTLYLKDIKVYPNPFASSVTVEFTLTASSEVSIQLVSMNGSSVYSKPKEKLLPGRYAIRLSPGRIASGVYIIRLYCGGQINDIKVIHK